MNIKPATKPKVRWIAEGEMFFVDYGNIHFAVNKEACAELIAALVEALYAQHDDLLKLIHGDNSTSRD